MRLVCKKGKVESFSKFPVGPPSHRMEYKKRSPSLSKNKQKFEEEQKKKKKSLLNNKCNMMFYFISCVYLQR